MLKKIMERNVSDYAPQVNEANFNPEMPPPAYPKVVPTKLKLAKIVSSTALVVVALIGMFILTGIYIQSSAPHCECEKVGIRRNDAQFEPLVAMPSEQKVEKTEVPLHFQLNKNVEEVMKKNKKAHINCVVEKKKATQVIANQPKTLMTPYGNITSDPGIIQMVGEKMMISCQTGMRKNPLKGKGDTGIRRRRNAQEMCDCSCAC